MKGDLEAYGLGLFNYRPDWVECGDAYNGGAHVHFVDDAHSGLHGDV